MALAEVNTVEEMYKREAVFVAEVCLWGKKKIINRINILEGENFKLKRCLWKGDQIGLLTKNKINIK